MGKLDIAVKINNTAFYHRIYAGLCHAADGGSYGEEMTFAKSCDRYIMGRFDIGADIAYRSVVPFVV